MLLLYIPSRYFSLSLHFIVVCFMELPCPWCLWRHFVWVVSSNWFLSFSLCICSLAEILQREVWCLWLFRNKTLEIGWRLIFCRSLAGWVKSKIKLNSSITGLSIVCAPHILVTCSYNLYSYTVAWTQLSVHWLYK